MNGKVQISLGDYIDEMLKSLPEGMAGESSTPAGNHLFTVNPDAVALSTEESDTPLCSQAAVSLQACKTRHTDCRGIS